MTPDTKKKALEKLHALNKNKIGYPDKWRDYSTVEVARGDYAATARRASRFEVEEDYKELGKPVDRTRWGMTPPTVNAYYSAQLAEIVFPAGILQPPFFDARADDAVNFGGIGVGDRPRADRTASTTRGASSTARATSKTGGPPTTARRSKQRAACVADQYSTYSPGGRSEDRQARLPERQAHARREPRRQRRRPRRLHGADEHAAGQGAHRRLAASRRSSASSSASRRCGARTRRPQSRCSASSRTRTRPGKFRTNGTLSNMEEFQKAFSCKPGSADGAREALPGVVTGRAGFCRSGGSGRSGRSGGSGGSGRSRRRARDAPRHPAAATAAAGERRRRRCPRPAAD